MEILAAFFLVVMIVNFTLQISSYFGQKRIPDASKLNAQAVITEMKSERVKYKKNDAKLRTVVTFSDGFQYISHKTCREDDGMTYRIFLDSAKRREILRDAIHSHDASVKRKKKVSIDTRFEEDYARIMGVWGIQTQEEKIREIREHRHMFYCKTCNGTYSALGKGIERCPDCNNVLMETSVLVEDWRKYSEEKRTA